MTYIYDMYICIYIYIYIYMYICMYICKYIYVYDKFAGTAALSHFDDTHINTHTPVYIYAYIYIHLHIYVYMHIKKSYGKCVSINTYTRFSLFYKTFIRVIEYNEILKSVTNKMIKNSSNLQYHSGNTKRHSQ